MRLILPVFLLLGCAGQVFGDDFDSTEPDNSDQIQISFTNVVFTNEPIVRVQYSVRNNSRNEICIADKSFYQPGMRILDKTSNLELLFDMSFEEHSLFPEPSKPIPLQKIKIGPNETLHFSYFGEPFPAYFVDNQNIAVREYIEGEEVNLLMELFQVFCDGNAEREDGSDQIIGSILSSGYLTTLPSGFIWN
ncbi:MAG: hypothetical protein ABJ327_00520 [Litoreibacter sp.]